jgi:hypothetical protein
MRRGTSRSNILIDGADQRPEDVVGVVQLAHNELRHLLKKREEIIRRIANVKRTILGLAELFGNNILTPDTQALLNVSRQKRKSGLTTACRSLLRESDHAMTAREILIQIRNQRPDLLAAHKRPIASVTTVLNRLVGYGEAQRLDLESNVRGWQRIIERQ